MTELIRASEKAPLQLRLARDLVRSLKRGHPWVFAEALRHRPPAPPGTPAILLDDKKGREIARGFYDPHSPLAFRVCTVEPDETLDDDWAKRSMTRAVTLRQMLFFKESTTGFRLFNGEGDGLPGLICDIYGDTAVIQLDGAGPSGFWRVQQVAEWVAHTLALRCVYLKHQARQGNSGEVLVGPQPTGPVPFLENGLHFTADVVEGQKTGFFLDQRENRQRIKHMAANRRVLNLFGYTGGFSVYAGLGGASHVTTVDMAAPALVLAEAHWQRNGLTKNHQTVKADAFKFLEGAAQRREHWAGVVLDPPSFAPSKETVPQALQAYQTLIAGSVTVTEPDGFLAAASCSSHVDVTAFLNACEEGIAKARRRATILGIYGQPADHPSPLVFSEFRYLKFVLLRVA